MVHGAWGKYIQVCIPIINRGLHDGVHGGVILCS